MNIYISIYLRTEKSEPSNPTFPGKDSFQLVEGKEGDREKGGQRLLMNLIVLLGYKYTGRAWVYLTIAFSSLLWLECDEESKVHAKS